MQSIASSIDRVLQGKENLVVITLPSFGIICGEDLPAFGRSFHFCHCASESQRVNITRNLLVHLPIQCYHPDGKEWPQAAFASVGYIEVLTLFLSCVKAAQALICKNTCVAFQLLKDSLAGKLSLLNPSLKGGCRKRSFSS